MTNIQLICSKFQRGYDIASIADDMGYTEAEVLDIIRNHYNQCKDHQPTKEQS